MKPDSVTPIPELLKESLADLKGPRLKVAEHLGRISGYFLDEGGGFERLTAFMKAHFSDQELAELRSFLTKGPGH